MFLSFSTDVYVIFLYWNILRSFTDVDIFLCGKCSRISILFLIIYWCWHIFHVQNVLIIFNRCSCDFLVLKHIKVIYWCWHIFVWKMFQNFNITFDYLLMLTIFHVQNVLIILDWCLCDFLVLKHIKVIYWCWHIFVWKMFQNFNIVFDYLLMLTYFSCVKCSYHSWLMFINVIFLYWNILMNSTQFIFIGYLLMLTYFCVENVPEFQYCFWLFTDVDIFFMCKMFLSFSIDVHVIFLYWNISRSFTDVDIFLCGKCSRISILFLIIYWCWHIFHV